MPTLLRRLNLTALTCAAGLLLLAAPAAAEDTYALDERLQRAGFGDAITLPVSDVDGSGYRIQVEYNSTSSSQPAYAREATEIAEIVWEHADGYVLAVDVVPVAQVRWLDDSLPPVRSFSRDELTDELGSRPVELDERTPLAPETELFAFGALLAFLSWAVGLAMGLAVWGLVALIRSNSPRPTWTGQPPHAQPVHGQPVYGQGSGNDPAPATASAPSWPAAPSATPNPTSARSTPFGDIDPHDPWKPPSR